MKFTILIEFYIRAECARANESLSLACVCMCLYDCGVFILFHIFLFSFIERMNRALKIILCENSIRKQQQKYHLQNLCISDQLHSVKNWGMWCDSIPHVLESIIHYKCKWILNECVRFFVMRKNSCASFYSNQVISFHYFLAIQMNAKLKIDVIAFDLRFKVGNWHTPCEMKLEMPKKSVDEAVIKTHQSWLHSAI